MLSSWDSEGFLFWKLFKRTAIVRLAEMDFGELLCLSLSRGRNLIFAWHRHGST
jgi:hypothetical protein